MMLSSYFIGRIKNMKNEFFINKILPVLSVFILVIFCFTSNVFAYDTVSTDNITYNFPDKITDYLKNTEYFNENYTCFGFYWNNQKYYVFFFEKTEKLKIHFYKQNGYWSFFLDSYSNGCHMIFDNSGNFEQKVAGGGHVTDGYICYEWFGNAITSDTILMANGDLYKEDDSLFFQLPPQTILRKVMEVEAEKKEITTTLVGLARLLIPFLICLIGFWKAWRLLLRILQKA
jgi:hypothetical protein